MDWFQQLREVLSDYYPAGSRQDIVGYLKGSANFKVWRSMRASGQEQMIILGSAPPTDEDWAAAGVAGRGGAVETVTRERLGQLVITYGGFSRRPWGRISSAEDPSVLQNYKSNTLDKFRDNRPTKTKAAAKAELIKSMQKMIERIERHAEMGAFDHRTQAGLTMGSQGHYSGFWGYWTNNLFNGGIPPQTIWNPCLNLVAHARSTLKEGKIDESGKAIIQARFELLMATTVYYGWKRGIVGAGKQMEIAIVAVALTVIFAAAVATVASAAGAAGAAGAASSEGATAAASATRLRVLLNTADGALEKAVETGAPSSLAYDTALAEMELETAKLMRMVL